jgi:flavodoxin
MKALVTYYSESGNTEKLANAVFEGIEHAEKGILPVQEVSNLDSYDLILVGFPVKSHSVPGKVKAVVKKIPDGKNVAFFSTHGSLRGGELAITAFYDALVLAKHVRILGTFGCRGKVKQKIIDSLMEKAEHRAWAQEAQSAVGHPDEADLEDGKTWARWMVTRARSHSGS